MKPHICLTSIAFALLIMLQACQFSSAFIRLFRTQNTKISHQQFKKLERRIMASNFTDENTLIDPLAYSEIVHQWQEEMNNEVDQLFFGRQLSVLDASRPLNRVSLVSVDAIIEELLPRIANLTEKVSNEFQELLSSNNTLIEQCSIQCVLELQAALTRAYRLYLENYMTKALDSLDVHLKKTSVTAASISVLQKRASTSANEVGKKINMLKNSLLEVFKKSYTGVLRESKQLQKYKLMFANSLDDSHMMSVLRSKMATMVVERIKSAQFQGQYNPYIRTLPIPPLKINFNYLLDPASIINDYEIHKLYEKHKNNVIAPNRAMELRFPQIQWIPFNPYAVPPFPEHVAKQEAEKKAARAKARAEAKEAKAREKATKNNK